MDFGTYPYVTSSSAAAGGACTGTGVGPTEDRRACSGIAKGVQDPRRQWTVSDRVDRRGRRGLQERGKEFGATTGRARRCGWFDGESWSAMPRCVNGFTSLAMTKLDVLDGCKELKLCTGYRYQGQALPGYAR